MNYNYSIIIPHFNHSIKLYNLIKSIPERNDIKIIMIDDNSNAALELLTFYESNGTCKDIELIKATR